jgi:hypothetical protein
MMGYWTLHVFSIERPRKKTKEEVESTVRALTAHEPTKRNLWTWASDNDDYYVYSGLVNYLDPYAGAELAQTLSEHLGADVAHLCWDHDCSGIWASGWIRGESYGETQVGKVAIENDELRKRNQELGKEIAQLREYIQRAYGEPVMGVLPGRESAVYPEPREDSTEVKL